MASWGLSVQKTVPTSTAATCSKSSDEKLRAIFHHFDDNHDGYLSYQELRRLQLQTSGDDLDGPTFCALCEEFKCQPQRGLTLAALRATYADGDGIDGGGEGSVSIEEDYDKIFPNGEEEEKDNGDGGQESGGEEQGGDAIADEVFRELVGKDKGKDPQSQEALDDAEQDETKKVGGASTGSTIWTDVHRACSVDTSTKVRALHQHFDVNRDKHLCYSELSALQMATSGERLEGPEYCHLCREHQCDPRKGLTIKALQQVYEENGMGHLDDDYDEVFQGRDPNEVVPASTPQNPAVGASSSSMYGFSLPELPSPSHLSNMLFGSGFGSSTIDQDSTNVASGEDGDEDEADKEHHPGASVIEQGEEKDNEESSGLLARIRSSPGRSKSADIDEHVIALHRFFDVYNTGRLGYCELRNLQLRTNGDDLDIEEYRMICEELDIDPREGLTAEALQRTYLSGGGNARNDYKKVFPSESVAAMFSSPEGRDLGVNLHGDYPFLAAERLEKVALIFQYFDDDQTGLLSYRKLRQLQLQTSGEDMDGPQFSTVCNMYKCDPQDGITLENLRDIYSSQGVDSSLDDDYRKIYRKYVWSVSRKEMDKVHRDKESSDETKDIQTQEGLVEEDVAEKGDESMQESGEGSMEKQTTPQISFV